MAGRADVEVASGGGVVGGGRGAGGVFGEGVGGLGTVVRVGIGEIAEGDGLEELLVAGGLRIVAGPGEGVGGIGPLGWVAGVILHCVEFRC